MCVFFFSKLNKNVWCCFFLNSSIRERNDSTGGFCDAPMWENMSDWGTCGHLADSDIGLVCFCVTFFMLSRIVLSKRDILRDHVWTMSR